MAQIVDRAGNSCFVDQAGDTVFFDQAGNVLTCAAFADSAVLMAQICMWSFDDLIEWDKCQPEQ